MVPESSHEYPYFDSLRLCLASFVYWAHGDVLTLFSPGNFAVQVFFALSGWLIGGILLNLDRSGLPRFFYNRVTRIWLPYLAAVLLLYGVAFLKDGLAPYYFHTLAFDLTLTHNWFIHKIPDVIAAMPLHGTGAHFWSIAVEEQFYLIAPLLLVLTPLRRSVLAWGIVTGAAVAQGGFYGSISAGVLAAMLRQRYGDWHLHRVAVAALLAVLVTASWAIWTGVLPYARSIPIVAVTIVLLTARPGRRTATGIFVGGISYPMYLHHWTGLFAANAVQAMVPAIERVPALVVGFGLALLVSSVAYMAIDQRVMRHRSAFYTPARGRAAMIAAYSLMVLGILLGTVIIGPLDSGPPR